VDYDVEDVTVTSFAAGKNSVALSSSTATISDKTVAPYVEFVAIDSDDNDKIDTIIVYPVSIVEVTYVGSDNVKAKPAAGGAATEYSTKDNKYTTYTGIAKEDDAYIIADTSLVTQGSFVNLPTLTGKVTSTTKDTAVIGGTSYDYSALTDKTQVSGKLDSTIDFRVINGYVVDAEGSTSVDLSDYALVTGVSGGTNAYGYYEAELLFTDGTSQVVTVKSVGDVKNAKPSADVLYTYEVSDGKYELTALTTLAGEGFDAQSSSSPTWTASENTSKANATITINGVKAKFASDAVVYVYDSDDGWVVKTGAQAAKITDTSATVTMAGADKNSSNALTVTFAVIKSDSASDSDIIYGYVTSDVTTTKSSKDTYYSFTVWNGASEPLESVANLSNGSSVQKGSIISYKLDENGKISKVDVLDAKGTAAAVTVIDGDDISVTTTLKAVYTTPSATFNIDDDDSTVLYIDSDKNKGDEGGILAIADYEKSGSDTTYISYNVWYIMGDDGKTVELLVVDSANNEWHGPVAE
jgi:hypothetical protein